MPIEPTKLNPPVLPLADSPETIAFRCIDNILRNDPVLSSVAQLIVSWRGEVQDVIQPVLTCCPFLRITPVPLPSKWETEGQHGMPMAIGIEAAVAGTDFDQLMNFWGAIRLALWPRDSAALTAVDTLTIAARINRGILTQPAYAVKIDEDSGAKISVGQGMLKLVLLIDT